jgi:D-serine deaminase-like pyridoxal phosphate-dependent protein
VTRFKCATIAEAEMTAQAGAPDVLLAYQPVGPNIARLATLVERLPQTQFSALVDNPDTAREIGGEFERHGLTIDLLVDLDVGMHRSGIEVGGAAHALYRGLCHMPGVRPGGLHAYDGHLRDADSALREARCEEAFAPVGRLRERLQREGLPVPRIVAGGTPTFNYHAARGDVECSPGTCVYWDSCYGGTLEDLAFEFAGLVLTRVISKPGGTRLCLDLGHKAIASENPHPRVLLFAPHGDTALPATFIGHSEEHLVLETPEADSYRIGDCLYGVPWHICPTVALYSEAQIVQDGQIVDRWEIQARARRLSI